MLRRVGHARLLQASGAERITKNVDLLALPRTNRDEPQRRQTGSSAADRSLPNRHPTRTTDHVPNPDDRPGRVVRLRELRGGPTRGHFRVVPAESPTSASASPIWWRHGCLSADCSHSNEERDLQAAFEAMVAESAARAAVGCQPTPDWSSPLSGELLPRRVHAVARGGRSSDVSVHRRGRFS